MILARDVCLKEAMYTLKDFKNAKKLKFIKFSIFNVSILLRVGNNEHQHISYTCF